MHSRQPMARLFPLLVSGIAGSALFGAGAMAIVQALDVRQGFSAYLSARDRSQFAQLETELEQVIAERGGASAFAGRPDVLRGVLGQQVHSLIAPMAPALAKRPPKRPDPPDDVRSRIVLEDLAGNRIAGPPLPRGTRGYRDAQVRTLDVEGAPVARIRLVPLPRIPARVGREFIALRMRNTALTLAALLAIGLAAAWWAARRMNAAAEAISLATRRIASGDYSARAPASRVREVAALGDDIDAMATRLSALDQARRRWLAEISHELRTPLAALRGEVEALVDGVREPSRRTLGSLKEEVIVLGRLVDDLYKFAASDLGSAACTFAPSEAGRLLAGAVERATPEAQRTGISLRLELPEGEIPVVWDGARMTQAFSNLLSNAVRYTDRPGRILVRLGTDGHVAHISLDDSAPGVARENIGRLGEPLFRAESGRARDAGGSGLGLSIVRAIVAAHGGSVSFAPSKLGGLRAELVVPLDARA